MGSAFYSVLQRLLRRFAIYSILIGRITNVGGFPLENYFHIRLDRQAVNEISALGLAHLGDGVFELLVRSQLCAEGRLTQTALHKATVALVSAPAQAARADRMLPLLTEEELQWFKRGRNAHAHHAAPKRASREQYGKATGLETLFGALYLLGQRDRINELFCLTKEEDHAL